MILEKQTETLVLEEGNIQTSTAMEIDADSHIFLMRMLSKFYSDGIGSLIRETASNALDSHRQCGSEEPIVVFFGTNSGGNYEFSVEDFGCGMDDEVVENVIKKYGKSTKRLEINQLGAFGLGFKSPLAYKSSFYFVGRKDGIERKWMMYESDDESNKIDLLFEGPTKEKNGVKIIVSVDYSDRDVFVTKIKEQLAYFENVFFDVHGRYESINNNFVIHRSKYFQYSELASNRNMHLCLDNVYYPIDWDKLGIPKIDFPIALRFSLSDGIFPIPNRESIKYTTEAKSIILKRIGEVADFFMEKYNATIKETEDVSSIYDYYNSSVRNVDVINEGESGVRVQSDLMALSKYASLPMEHPTLKGISKFPIKRISELNNFILKEYSKYWQLSYGRLSAVKYGNDLTIRDVKSSKYYICSDKITGVKKDYIKSLHPSGYIYFIKKIKEFKLGGKRPGTDYTTYYDILELKKFPKNEWRELIKEYKYIISLLIKDFINLNEIIIPQSFIDARKKIREEKIVEKKRKKIEGEISGKELRELERFVNGKNSKLVSENYDLETIHQNKFISVYGKMDDAPLMDKLYGAFDNNKVKFIIFSEREIKNLEEIELHNWTTIEKFMKGDNKSFKRVVTSYLIEQLRNDQNYVFGKFPHLKGISEKLHNDIVKLDGYRRKWYKGGNNEIYKIMLELAENNNLFDESIYFLYKDVKNVLEKLKFLNPLFGTINNYSRDEYIIDAISDLFKYYKYKVNTDRYKLITNDEILPTEEMSEELIEDLTL